MKTFKGAYPRKLSDETTWLKEYEILQSYKSPFGVKRNQ